MCRVKFSVHYGRSIRLARDRCSAVRVGGFNEGILLSDRKLPNDKVFEVCTRIEGKVFLECSALDCVDMFMPITRKCYICLKWF